VVFIKKMVGPVLLLFPNGQKVEAGRVVRIQKSNSMLSINFAKRLKCDCHLWFYWTMWALKHSNVFFFKIEHPGFHSPPRQRHSSSGWAFDQFKGCWFHTPLRCFDYFVVVSLVETLNANFPLWPSCLPVVVAQLTEDLFLCFAY